MQIIIFQNLTRVMIKPFWLVYMPANVNTNIDDDEGLRNP